MTDDTLERLARQAGLERNRGIWTSEQADGVEPEELARFAALVRADERERCKLACAEVGKPNPDDPNSTNGEHYRCDVAQECIAAIEALPSE